MNIVPILFYTFIEFIILLYTFLVISPVSYKQYMISRNWFSKFSCALPAFTCKRFYWKSLNHFFRTKYFEPLSLRLVSYLKYFPFEIINNFLSSSKKSTCAIKIQCFLLFSLGFLVSSII